MGRCCHRTTLSGLQRLHTCLMARRPRHQRLQLASQVQRLRLQLVQLVLVLSPVPLVLLPSVLVWAVMKVRLSLNYGSCSGWPWQPEVAGLQLVAVLLPPPCQEVIHAVPRMVLAP